MRTSRKILSTPPNIFFSQAKKNEENFAVTYHYRTPSIRFREDTSIEFTRHTCKPRTKDQGPRIFSVESVIILVLTCQNQNTVVRMTRITYQVRNGVTVRLIWDITISILSKIAKISESVICESLAWNRYLGVLLSGTV